jgi:hypothetical protein
VRAVTIATIAIFSVALSALGVWYTDPQRVPPVDTAPQVGGFAPNVQVHTANSEQTVPFPPKNGRPGVYIFGSCT